MNGLAPLEALYDPDLGPDLPLPPELARLYSRLQFPPHRGRTYVIANFVSTLDGVVSLNVPGHEGGGDISGFDPADRMIMGLLRAVASAVIVGSGTLRATPGHLWNAETIYPPLASAYADLRARVGLAEPPLNVFISGRGDVDPEQRVFQSGEAPVLVVTRPAGARRLASMGLPPSVRVEALPGEGRISARAALETIYQARPADIVLVEGGPRVMADFFGERCLDEQFLTLAPQVAGRSPGLLRPGLVEGRTFAPESPRWGTLIGVKRDASHLFLRYAWPREETP